jgi:uncharacterized protein (TIGR03437 family)
MYRRTAAAIIFGLLPAGYGLHLAASRLPFQPQRQQITASPAGPFRVSGNRLLDSHGRPFLMRGTQLTEFHPQTVDRDNRAGEDFGPHSATSLSAIRLRFNMNTVRLPLNVLESGAPEYFPRLANVVRRANQIDLLVVLAAREPGAAMPSEKTVEFWGRCAAFFKDYPNVLFDVFSDPSPTVVALGVDPHSAAGWEFWRNGMQGPVRAIRAAGATQPIVAMGWKDDRLFEGSGASELINDGNIIYEASPRYLNTHTDAERDAHFGHLTGSVPVLANGWDLELDDATACAAVPHDPTAAAAMVQGNLDYFDAHAISWTVSTFEPGKLIRDLSFHDASTLENGWTCGAAASAGLGRVIEAHLRASEERGLFVVSGSGGPDVARGAISLAYGPILAAYDAKVTGPRAARSLGHISVQVTDSQGVTRPAGMLWASAGWGQTNFVIPAESATGPAVLSIVRDDGSRNSTNITIADTAPGFLTGQSCRGPAIGSATEIFAGGRTSTSEISRCTGVHCETIPISMAGSATTRVRIKSSGFRYASSVRDIEVTIGGVPVPVVSYGPDKDPGFDFLTIEIPESLRGMGETDLMGHIHGRPSNAVRIYLGGQKPAAAGLRARLGNALPYRQAPAEPRP